MEDAEDIVDGISGLLERCCREESSSCVGSILALPRRCCRGTSVSNAGEILSLKGLGSAPGPSPKYAKLMAFRLPQDAPQLEEALPYYGSVAKDMSLWPHTQFVCGLESGAASAAQPRHLCLKRKGDFLFKGLGLGPGSEP